MRLRTPRLLAEIERNRVKSNLVGGVACAIPVAVPRPVANGDGSVGQPPRFCPGIWIPLRLKGAEVRCEWVDDWRKIRGSR